MGRPPEHGRLLRCPTFTIQAAYGMLNASAGFSSRRFGIGFYYEMRLMRNVPSPRLLAHLALAIAVGGCAQGPSVNPNDASGVTQTFARPATHFYGYDFVYVSQPSDNEVVVYKRKRHGDALKPYETLSSGFSAPMGMVTTPDGHWYVANALASNVLVYNGTRHGPQGPTQTLDDSGEIPVNVAATPNRHVVAVSNGSSTAGNAGSVSIYLNKADAPSYTLTFGADPLQGAGIAIDGNGDCFWSFKDPRQLTGSIVEFPKCKGSGMQIQTGILQAGGLAFDRSGNLYYVDELLGIFKCNGISSCGLFLSVGGVLGVILPKNINFDRRSPQNLWVADGGGYIDAVNLQGIIVYLLQALGGILNPPDGIAPVPGG